MSLFERNVHTIALGCCVSSEEQLAVIEGTAADYTEPPVASVVMAPLFDELGPRLASSPCPARAANVFLPGDLAVVGPAVDQARVEAYVGEAAAFVRQRDLSQTRVLADLYHMQEEGEDLGALDDSADLLAHVHVADSGRRPPGQGDWPVPAFLERLRTIGYTGACSIECLWTDFAREAPAAVAHLRAVAEGAGWAVGSARHSTGGGGGA